MIDKFKFKAFADNNLNVFKMAKFVPDGVEKNAEIWHLTLYQTTKFVPLPN